MSDPYGITRDKPRFNKKPRKVQLDYSFKKPKKSNLLFDMDKKHNRNRDKLFNLHAKPYPTIYKNPHSHSQQPQNIYPYQTRPFHMNQQMFSKQKGGGKWNLKKLLWGSAIAAALTSIISYMLLDDGKEEILTKLKRAAIIFVAAFISYAIVSSLLDTLLSKFIN